MNPRVLSSFDTMMSSSLLEAKHRVRALYRQALKATPEICQMYTLEVEPQVLRQRIAHEFRKHPYTEEVHIIDILAAKGRQELQETLAFYKTKSHVLRYATGAPEASVKRLEVKEKGDGMSPLLREVLGV
eukprot:tig00001049_g6655.t1